MWEPNCDALPGLTDQCGEPKLLAYPVSRSWGAATVGGPQVSSVGVESPSDFSHGKVTMANQSIGRGESNLPFQCKEEFGWIFVDTLDGGEAAGCRGKGVVGILFPQDLPESVGGVLGRSLFPFLACTAQSDHWFLGGSQRKSSPTP